MSLPERILLYISERDVDLLLVEELTVSPRFSGWFASQAGIERSDAAELIGAWHSVSDPSLGESDLIALWRMSDGARIALLVENKVNACAQPEQGVRYQKRGELGIDAGDWDRFKTCMIAPERYFASSRDAQVYSVRISYEAIRDFLCAGPSIDARSRYRAAVLESAIEQQRRGYSPETDEQVTRFWRAFWDLASSSFPRINMEEPGPKPVGSGWIWVRPPELNTGHRVAFKLAQGIVDLQIDGAVDHAESLDALCKDRLSSEIRAVRTGKSTSLRFEVEPVDVTQSFEDQRELVVSVLEGANRLLDAFKILDFEVEL